MARRHRVGSYALAVLLCACLPPTAAGKDDKEKKAPLLRFAPPGEYRRAWDGTYAHLAKKADVVRKCRIGATTLLLFDVDADGVWGEVGVDAWTVLDKRIHYAFPCEEAIAIETQRVRFSLAENQRTLRYRITPHGASAVHRKVVDAYNRFRMQNGLTPVWIDDALSDACHAHVRYMELNNSYGHAESPELAGYTEAGANAGMKSVLNADTTPLAAVTEWWRTVFHRNGICHPRTRSCGIASSAEYVVLDALSDLARRPWTYPVVVPPPDCDTHPITMMDEATNPIPKGTGAGCPITLKFGVGSRAAVEKAELRIGSKTGKSLDLWISSPAQPAIAKRPKNRFNICLIPKVQLKPRTTYFVHVSWREPGKDVRTLEWTFRTAAR